MTEQARPVVEAAVAPNTPQSEETTGSNKLSYAVSALPKPVSNPDFYLHAQLVEARALRMELAKLVDAVDRLIDAQKPASGAAATPLGASKPAETGKPAETKADKDK